MLMIKRIGAWALVYVVGLVCTGLAVLILGGICKMIY